MNNDIKTLWDQGHPALAAWLQMPGTLHAEALARMDYDAVVLDLQHSMIDFKDAAAMMVAVELGGAVPFVRLQENRASDAMKLLDAGAYGIISPMTNTRADAETLASALHYQPRGLRSFGPRRPALKFGSDYVKYASDTIVGLAMIETREALSNLDDILDVDGIDGVFIGATDLALDLGFPPQVDSRQPQILDAVEHVRRSAKARGKRVGIFCGSGAYAAEKFAEGFDFVTAAPDLNMLLGAARDVIVTARKQK